MLLYTHDECTRQRQRSVKFPFHCTSFICTHEVQAALLSLHSAMPLAPSVPLSRSLPLLDFFLRLHGNMDGSVSTGALRPCGCRRHKKTTTAMGVSHGVPRFFDPKPSLVKFHETLDGGMQSSSAPLFTAAQRIQSE